MHHWQRAAASSSEQLLKGEQDKYQKIQDAAKQPPSTKDSQKRSARAEQTRLKIDDWYSFDACVRSQQARGGVGWSLRTVLW